MHYTIDLAGEYLRAELFGRQTVEQTQEFVQALAAEAQKHARTKLLIAVRNSRPIFKVDVYLSERFKQLAGIPGTRIALLADSEELRASHEYIELRARQEGLEVRAFRQEGGALEWLRS